MTKQQVVEQISKIAQTLENSDRAEDGALAGCLYAILGCYHYAILGCYQEDRIMEIFSAMAALSEDALNRLRR